MGHLPTKKKCLREDSKYSQISNYSQPVFMKTCITTKSLDNLEILLEV